MAGTLAGLTVVVRPAGLVIAVVLALWLFAVTRERPRHRLAAVAAVAVPAIVRVAGYVIVQHDRTGQSAVLRASGWYVYGRAAPFADCEKFTPPPGTARLCEDKPSSQRPGPTHYVFDPDSPAVGRFGNPLGRPGSPDARPGDFGRAALLAQPFDWLKQVTTEDLPRYLHSGWRFREDEGPSYGELRWLLTYSRDSYTTAVVGGRSSGDGWSPAGVPAWCRPWAPDRQPSLHGRVMNLGLSARGGGAASSTRSIPSGKPML